MLGTAGLPHVLMRFYTVPTAKEARRSVVWAIGLIGAFYLFTLILGYGAAALVGPDTILAAPGGQNSAAPLLAFELGGTILLGVISAVAFATILAVVAGLTITASASFAHDVYASVLKSHKVTEDEQVRVSRITAVVLGVLAIGLGILANGQNVAFLVALAFAVAASANLPTIVYSLYWKRFNTRGALWSMYGGLISCIVLIVFSPAVSGAKTSMLPGADFALVPAVQPGHRVDPAGVHPRHRRHADVPRHRRPGSQRRDGGALADRRGRREGDSPLSRLAALAAELPAVLQRPMGARLLRSAVAVLGSASRTSPSCVPAPHGTYVWSRPAGPALRCAMPTR